MPSGGVGVRRERSCRAASGDDIFVRPHPRRSPLIHAFTVDFEDWFHGIPVDTDVRLRAERRLEKSANRLLDLLGEANVRGTFFLLGPLVTEIPSALLRRLVVEGHELGCHGWSHDLLYTLTPEKFREETRRAKDRIEQVTGVAVNAYRAAYFSITRDSLWALEILAELGFRYDSSIFPVRNWRYGIPDFDSGVQRLSTTSGPLLEFPMSVIRRFGAAWPVTGGAYFRIYPYGLTRANLRRLEEESKPGNFYLHPWELDPDHPRVPFSWKPRLTHYFNLGATEPRLKRLLRDFTFAPLGTVLDGELARGRVTETVIGESSVKGFRPIGDGRRGEPILDLMESGKLPGPG